jgi:transposase
MYKRHAPTEARERAFAALKANPDATPTEIAKIAKVSRATVVNARADLAKEARKAARKQARKPRESTPDPRERAQRFLKDALAHGPKQVSAVEEAAAKAYVDPQTLERARADRGIVTSRSNAGGVMAVQWSLPG